MVMIMEEVLKKLSDNGYKITPQRRLILEVITNSKQHLTAEEIAEKIKLVEPSISLATVYRNLKLMVDLGLLSRLDLHHGPPSYEFFQGHNHHLVCRVCGKATKLGVCPMQGEILKVIEQNGFEVDSHHFEIMGYCKDCQAKIQ